VCWSVAPPRTLNEITTQKANKMRMPLHGPVGILLVIGICFVSLLVKLTYIAFVVPGYKPAAACSPQNHGFISFRDFGMEGDEGDYVWIAYNLLYHRQFSMKRSLPLVPTAFRGPGFPFFIAGIFTLLGLKLWPLLVAHALLMCTVAGLIYWLSLLLSQRRSVALTACILAAVHPAALYFGSGNIMSEGLYVPLLTLSVCLLALAHRTSKHGHASLSGAVLGLAALTRSEALGLAVLAAIWIAFSSHSVRRGIGLVAALVLPLFAVLLPWGVRNALVFDRFMVNTTQAGEAFYGANNRQAVDQSPGTWVSLQPEVKAALGELSEPERSKKAFQLGFKELRSMGFRNLLKLETFKLIRYLLPAQRVYSGTRLRDAFFKGSEVSLLSAASWITLLLVPLSCCIAITVVLGLRIMLRDAARGNRVAILLLVVQAYYIAIALIFFGDTRFRFMVEPQLCIFAAMGISTLLGWISKKKARLRPGRTGQTNAEEQV